MQETLERERAPMTDWGMQVSLFCLTHGLTKKGLAEAAGVKYDTMMKAMRGVRAGHAAQAAIQETMERYETTHKGVGA